MDTLYPSYTFAAANYGRLTSPNTWTTDNTFSAGQVTFSGYVPLCSTAPTSVNHLCNKAYVDSATGVGTTTNVVLNYATANSLNITSVNGPTGNKQINAHIGLRMDATGSVDLCCNGNCSVGASVGVGKDLVVGGGAAFSGTVSIGNSVNVSGASTFNDFVSFNGCLSAGGVLYGYTYNAGYWHITNTYSFPIGRSQADLTAIFGSTLNVSVLLGNYGVGYILINPFYKAIIIGGDGSVLFTADNTLGGDIKLFFITYENPNLTAAAGLFIYYLENLV